MTHADVQVTLEDFTDRRIALRVDLDGTSSRLTYAASDCTWSAPPETMDFAAVALAHFASARGRNLFVAGSLTTSQLSNLEEYIQIWSVWQPTQFKRIAIRCERIVDDVSPGQKPAIMMFSGGIDASFALLSHKQNMLGALSRPVTRGVLVVGCDLPHDDAVAQRTAFASARSTLRAFDCDCVSIATNWKQDFCPSWENGHNAMFASILQTFAADYGTGIVANDISYREELTVGMWGNLTVLNRLLGSNGFPIVATDGLATRMERLREICRHPIVLQNLRFCWQADAGGRNCGRCRKCVSTRMQLIACGVDPEPLFDHQIDEADIAGVILPFGSHTKIYVEDIRNNLAPTHRLHRLLTEILAADLASKAEKSRAGRDHMECDSRAPAWRGMLKRLTGRGGSDRPQDQSRRQI